MFRSVTTIASTGGNRGCVMKHREVRNPERVTERERRNAELTRANVHAKDEDTTDLCQFNIVNQPRKIAFGDHGVPW